MLSNDTTSRPPINTGTYAYTTFKDGASGFPAVGGTYLDPILGTPDASGSTIRRLTNYPSNSGNSFIYAHHWSNADGTYFFDDYSASINICSTSTGAVIYSGQPQGDYGGQLEWHPTDPNKYFFIQGAGLYERNLSGGTSTLIFTGGASLTDTGNSHSWVDGTGDIFIVQWSGVVRVWQRSSNTTYGTTITPLGGGGYSAMAPNGAFVIDAGGGNFRSYALNNSTHTVGAAVNFATSAMNAGDHAGIVSATDGKTYGILGSSNNGGIYSFDVTHSNAGQTEAAQQASATLLYTVDASKDAGHMSGNIIGANKNWFFKETQDVTVTFGDGVSPWHVYKNEIISCNVVTGEVRRHCQHRARYSSSMYWSQPRVSCSWDGSFVMWLSNYGDNSPSDYADMYGINDPLGADVSAGYPIRGFKV